MKLFDGSAGSDELGRGGQRSIDDGIAERQLPGAFHRIVRPCSRLRAGCVT